MAEIDWTFGNFATYEEASARAVAVEREEIEAGRSVTKVTIIPNTGNTGGYNYLLESVDNSRQSVSGIDIVK